MVLSTTQGTVGAAAPAAALPSGWVHTGENLGAGVGDDGTPNGILAVSVVTTSVGNANFGILLTGSISGYVLADTDNNGSGDAPLPNVHVTLVDADGNPVDGDPNTAGVQPITQITDTAGSYTFANVIPGTYGVKESQPTGYGSVSDKDGGNPDEIRPITVAAGVEDSGNNFIDIQFGSIAGTVRKDTNNDGSGDAPFAGVTIKLLDGSGNPVDGDPITPGVQAVTTITAVDGSYLFANLMPRSYQVAETQPSGYASVSDADGGNLDLIGNITPLTVAPGQDVTGRDFVEIELGSISGFVYSGTTPLAGVTLTLLDDDGNPVDADPDTPGVQKITTVTGADGSYTFTGVKPGSYQIGQTQPLGYNSVGDSDGGNPNIVGDVNPVVVTPGQNNGSNNFLEKPITCPTTWAEWKFLHPGQTADGNPDGDAYDNFNEFAFAMPYDSGAGNAWLVQASTLHPGTLEGVFTRPTGAPDNVTYTLQYAATAGNPTVWLSKVITPDMFTTVDNGDCTETITLHDLENLTGLTGGAGVVRIKADLLDGTDTHTSFTEVEGWKETPIELSCQTYNNPYLRETVFTGTVGTVNGQNLTFANSAGSVDLATLLTGGVSYYLEVTSGDNEGQRFDVASANGDTLTLTSDGNLYLATPPFNTLTGALPATLAGDTVVLRRHWTLNEIFPPSGFGASGSQSTADEVQVFAGGAWRIYWLYNDGTQSRWVDVADGLMVDQGSTVIPPGQGMFFNDRTTTKSVLAYGEVRANQFVQPLAAGYNLIGGGYPVDQSAAGPGGRAMTLSAGFFGSRDFKTADSFFTWKADSTVGAAGYTQDYLLNTAPINPLLLRWIRVGDVGITPRDNQILLPGNRATFLRAAASLPNYGYPNPWTP